MTTILRDTMQVFCVVFLISIIRLVHCLDDGISTYADSTNTATRLQNQTAVNDIGLRWNIHNDVLILHWNHSATGHHREQYRYYICIHEIEHTLDSNNNMIQPLSQVYFIPVKTNHTLTSKIRGLKPFSMYRAKVIAISKSTTKASNYVYVNTKHLKFLKVYNLTVSHVTNISAIIRWNYHAVDIPSRIYFKLTCNGLWKYKHHKENIQEKVSFVHKSRSAVSALKDTTSGQYTTSSLYPNVHYTCYMQSVITDSGKSSDPYNEIKFHTKHGRPPVPPKPQVIINNDDRGKRSTLDSFVVKLYESSNKYGQISHYIVYAVPVKRPKDSPVSIPFVPIVPYTQLLSKSVTVHLASSISTCLPFIVNEYNNDYLPEKISFNASYQDAFKRDTHYTFVVTAFACNKDRNCSFYSMSPPSDPPLYIDKDDNDLWIKNKKSRIQHLASAALYTIMTVVSILTGITLTILLVTCAHNKTHHGINLKLLSNIGISKKPKNKGIEVGAVTSEEENLLYVKKISSRKLPPRKTQFRHKRFGSTSSGGGSGLQLSNIIAKKNENHSTRVDKVKLLDNTENDQEQELRLDLFSITTPPDSPCSKQKRPSSPLTTSHRSVHVHVPTSPASSRDTLINNNNNNNNNKYVTSSVASHINQDVLVGTFTLPRSRPYVPPQRSFKIRSSATPKMPDPLPPKSSSRSVKEMNVIDKPQEVSLDINSEDKSDKSVQIIGKIEDKFVDDLIETI